MYVQQIGFFAEHIRHLCHPLFQPFLHLQNTNMFLLRLHLMTYHQTNESRRNPISDSDCDSGDFRSSCLSQASNLRQGIFSVILKGKARDSQKVSSFLTDSIYYWKRRLGTNRCFFKVLKNLTLQLGVVILMKHPFGLGQ